MFLGLDRRALVGLAVGVPISAAFLWLALVSADLTVVRRTLEQADAGLVVLAVVAMAGVYGFQAVRWRKIARSPQVGLARFYEMVVSGVACNNVLPARVGDLFRARWLAREARMPGGRGLGTVVLDRGCDLVALFILLLLGLAAVATSEWLVRITIGGALALAGLAAILLFARGYTGRYERGRLSRGVLRGVLRDTAEALAEPIGRRSPVVWIVLSLGAWTTWAVGAMLVARSLDVELTLVDAMFVAAVMNLGVAIPSSPGFVGTYEWLGVASLGLLGIPSEEALAFAILLHASWYVPTTLAGGSALGVRAFIRIRRARAARTAVPTISSEATSDERP
jgi:glycosyltransferase 2 family protein